MILPSMMEKGHAAQFLQVYIYIMHWWDSSWDPYLVNPGNFYPGFCQVHHVGLQSRNVEKAVVTMGQSPAPRRVSPPAVKAPLDVKFPPKIFGYRGIMFFEPLPYEYRKPVSIEKMISLSFVLRDAFALPHWVRECHDGDCSDYCC